MTVATANRGEKYLADYRRFQDEIASRDGSAWLNELRQRAWQRFDELGFPTHRRGNELFKYTNLRPLDQTEFVYPFPGRTGSVTAEQVKASVPWSDDWTTIVFVDGHYSEDLSNFPAEAENLYFRNLRDAAADDRATVEAQLGRLADAENNPFAALNTAFLDEGAFVRVPDGVQLAGALHLVYVTTPGDSPRVTHPRNLIWVGKESSLRIVESYVSAGDQTHFSNAISEYILDESADVDYYRVMVENENAFHYGATRTYLSENSRFDVISFATGQAIGRNDVHIQVDGPGAKTELKGLYISDNKQHLDNHINATHSAPSGSSSQFYKGILSGQSRAVFSGLVYVTPEGQKTYANQKDLNLVLSRGAEIDTKPSLEIFADDVQVFHGATAGHVDLDTIYYMQTRGLDLDTAKAMLIRGFASEMIEDMKLAELQEFAQRVTDEWIPRMQVERE